MRMIRKSLVGLLVAASLVATASARGQEEPAVGRVIDQTGPATLLRGGRPAPLIIGTPIAAADMIVTGHAAQAMIEFADGSVVVIGPDCQIEVAEYAVDPAGSRWSAVLSLLAGIVRATVQPAEGGRLEIRTQTAVASARSTDWLVDAAADTTGVFVIEGSVAVAGYGQTTAVVLQPGFGTDVQAGGAPTEPKRWGAGRVERTLAQVRLR